jgi:hypothetical protein
MTKRTLEEYALIREIRRDYRELKARLDEYWLLRDTHRLYRTMWEKTSNLLLELGNELEKRNWPQDEDSDAVWESDPQQL